VTPCLLDISRLISRMGRGPLTGIDRVELAYFQRLLSRPAPAYFLCRLPRAYAILDAQGGQAIFGKIKRDTGWGSSGAFRILTPRATSGQQRALADVARHAVKLVPDWRLSDSLRRLFPQGVVYFNTGHSNQRQQVFSAISKIGKSKIIVLIHDIIPLSYPNFSTLQTTNRFRSDMARVSAFADLVIYNSATTREQAEAHFQTCGRVPPHVIAHLGTDYHQASYRPASAMPQFVIAGTIEPRKNHALVLNLWRNLCETLPATEIPGLHIVGRRGWNNDEVFRILDTDPMMGQHVFEHNNMNDDEYHALLAQSWGLLFPSFVEGFGLPLIEAALHGVPILCGQNAVFREILGDYPLYLNVDNFYDWRQGILERAGRKRESEADRQGRGRSVNLPDWTMHFDRIFRFV